MITEGAHSMGNLFAEWAAGPLFGPQRETPPRTGVAFWLEPPIGIEPMTYSLRVNRSAD